MWQSIIWMVAWPILASLALAAVAWLVAWRLRPRPEADGRWRTVIAAGAATVLMMGYPFTGPLPLWVDISPPVASAVADARYALPLAIGLIVVVVIGLVRRRRTAAASAHLTPRTWRSFIATGWLWAYLVALVTIVGLTVAAGLASEADEQGNYTMYWVDLGSMTIGSSIYGWHHSLVPLVVLALLTAATWWALASIARPPLNSMHGADSLVRQLRSTDVMRMVIGALLLHLKAVLASLANTSAMTGGMSGPDGGHFTSGTPFSALTGVLHTSATLVGIVGLALWIATALSALPRPVRSSAVSAAP